MEKLSEDFRGARVPRVSTNAAALAAPARVKNIAERLQWLTPDRVEGFMMEIAHCTAKVRTPKPSVKRGPILQQHTSCQNNHSRIECGEIPVLHAC